MNIIIGGGKYGCKAVELLRKNHEDFVVIDTDPNCQAVKRFNLKSSVNFDERGEYFLHGDLSTVVELVEKLKPEYIFPTAPVHIAADMAQIKFQLVPWREAINTILPRLPHSVILIAGKGKIILSFNRDHECVDNCSMPETCPSSGIKKPCTMTKLMQYASPEAFILLSHSMAPGMGALKGAELQSFFSWAKTKDKFVVGTSCDCHGVFSAFKKVNH
ncbi:MAG: NAD-binding protein [Candidatus Bathyarchaeota archaeon]|nr:NAD-binding protein [Candidatus Bathyarchaeota archaeon]